VANRYEILESAAGQGGFGRVDRAVDRVLEREVAIKTLDPLFSVEPSPTHIERFHREAKALARLSHPNIPAIYDVQLSEETKEFRIVFEWIEGETLTKHLQDRGTLSLEEARQLFSRICSALAHAHDFGIVHRDVKPSNIILTQDLLSCYLVDFGIAVKEGDLSLTSGSAVGTPGYMSPEQERGDDLTGASDIFSLGIVLYECLAGVRPTAGVYMPLSRANESIPPSIDALVQEALRAEPERRPGSANQFSLRLSEALQPHANFTAILAEGSLHEIQLGLTQMDAARFVALPAGQRVLLMTRLGDLIRVDEPRMRNAVAALLAELVRVAPEIQPDNYKTVVECAFEYGYEKQYGEAWHGSGPLRTELNAVSLGCRQESHSIIAEHLLAKFDTIDLTGHAGWYYHDLRVLLQNLLTNPRGADEHAEPIGRLLSDVNEVSHKVTP
jgi:serine/threonine-protein kinase